MSSRGAILLAIGMLVLGLLLGGLTGGVAGFVVGQGARPAVSQFVPRGNAPQPNQPNQNPNPNPLPFGPRGAQPGANAVNGAVVAEVTADSPAAKAGLQVGDLITSVGGTKIDANHSLSDLVQAKKPGDTVDLAVTRGTQNLTITVTLGASQQDSNVAFLGIRFTPSMPGGNRPRGGSSG
jgi:predicted metalloprotease with PDZ domain